MWHQMSAFRAVCSREMGAQPDGGDVPSLVSLSELASSGGRLERDFQRVKQRERKQNRESSGGISRAELGLAWGTPRVQRVARSHAWVPQLPPPPHLCPEPGDGQTSSVSIPLPTWSPGLH